MKPTGTRRVLLLAVVSLALILRADDPPPAKPAKHGGYGSGPAAPAPAPAPGPAGKTDGTADWMVAAEAHRGAVIDEISRRFAAAKGAWAGSGDKYAENAYRQFYSKSLDVVTQADLRRISNPAIYSSGREPIYPEGNRAAVESAMAALDDGMKVFRFYDGVVLREAGSGHGSGYLQVIANLSIFFGFQRLVTQQKNLIVRRIDPLVPLVEVARRMDPHIQALGARSEQIANEPAIKEWKIDAAPFVRFYDRQLAAIDASLRRWFQRGGATEAELSRIDAQMKATQQADPLFIAELKKLENEEQQQKALFDRSQVLYDEVAALDGQARNLRSNGDYPGAHALDAQAEPLARQEAQLDQARGQIRDQEAQDEKPAVAQAEQMNFVEPVPSGHVTGVEFILATEDQPEKAVVPEFPLKGAPVSLSLTRQVSDVALGIPFVIRVRWEQDEGTAPAEQTLNLVIGKKSVALAMHVDPYGSSYTSSRVIFLPPPGAPGAPPAQP